MPENVHATDAQTRLVAALQSPDAYPHEVEEIGVVETHISWVFLTGSFAYKVKKAVTLDFLDFGTLERRRHYCEEELRLNRRWAPELYLDVVAITGSVARPQVEGDGEAVEYAVKMTQFPESAQLDRQLDAGLLTGNDLFKLAETVADYHAAAPVIEYANDRETVLKIRAPVLDNFKPLEQVIDMQLITRVHGWTVESLRRLKPELIQRRKAGFVRECHGDLHLANLARLPSGIVAFDGVEFSAELRNIDVISDLAFLFMDLVARARQDLAAVFLNRYLERTGDYAGMQVFSLYFVYHCMIRAKVAAIRSLERDDATDREDDIDALKHNVAVAVRWMDRRPPILLAMHGFSGSGKTWLSTRLLSRLPAIRLRSDIERKRQLGLAETDVTDSPTGAGAYSEQSKADVYRRLLESADRLLSAGFNVIVDASFLRREAREDFAQLAERRSVEHVIIETVAGAGVLRQRLTDREEAGVDASEANVDVLDFQQSHCDALGDDERKRTISVATDRDIGIDGVVKAVRETLRQ